MKPFDRAVSRSDYQSCYSARSSNHSPPDGMKLIIDVDFRTVCREEGVSSRRVLKLSILHKAQIAAKITGLGFHGHDATIKQINKPLYFLFHQRTSFKPTTTNMFSCGE